MSISDDLTKIKDIKKKIHQSIANKEVDIADDLPFEDYPSKIDKITSGGGVSGQEFTVNNDTGYDIKSGDLVWVDWAPYVQGETKVTEMTERSEYIPSIINQAGTKVFSGYNGESLNLDGLTIKNSGFDFYNSYIIPYSIYISQNTGEVINSNNFSFSDSGTKAYRSDSVYVKIGEKLVIPGDTHGAYYQNVFYVGENYFIRTSSSAPDGYEKCQLFKVDTSTAKILKQWKLNVPDTSKGYLMSLQCAWVLHSENKTYLADFYNGLKYELPMEFDEDLPSVDPIESITIGRIFPIGLTRDDNFMIVRGSAPSNSSSWSQEPLLQIYKRGQSVDDWTLLTPEDLSLNITEFYGYQNLQFIYNPINQVITISTGEPKNYTYGKVGKAFRYIGINEADKVIFEELPCDVSKFVQTTKDAEWSQIQFTFGPTYSQDCGKYIISKLTDGSVASDGKTHFETIVGYAKTGIFLNCVKDPSNFGAFAIQGIAKQDIPNGTSGKITTLALEQIDINLTSNLDIDFEVQTGV